jgi:hypothetical protein
LVPSHGRQFASLGKCDVRVAAKSLIRGACRQICSEATHAAIRFADSVKVNPPPSIGHS